MWRSAEVITVPPGKSGWYQLSAVCYHTNLPVIGTNTQVGLGDYRIGWKLGIFGTQQLTADSGSSAPEVGTATITCYLYAGQIVRLIYDAETSATSEDFIVRASITSINNDYKSPSDLIVIPKNELATRWEFGKRLVKWTSNVNPTSTTPVGAINGNSLYSSGAGFSELRLTDIVDSQTGRMYWDLSSLATTFNNWEIRASVRITDNVSGGTPSMWLMGGATSNITTDTSNSLGAVSMKMEGTPNDVIVYTGTTAVTTNSNNVNIEDTNTKIIALRKIGNIVTGTVNLGGISSDNGRFIATVESYSDSSDGTNTYFGIGAETSTGANYNLVYSFEVRSFDLS